LAGSRDVEGEGQAVVSLAVPTCQSAADDEFQHQDKVDGKAKANPGREAWADVEEGEEDGDQGPWGCPDAGSSVSDDVELDDSGIRSGPGPTEAEEDEKKKLEEQEWHGGQAAKAPSEEAAADEAADYVATRGQQKLQPHQQHRQRQHRKQHQKHQLQQQQLQHQQPLQPWQQQPQQQQQQLQQFQPSPHPQQQAPQQQQQQIGLEAGAELASGNATAAEAEASKEAPKEEAAADEAVLLRDVVARAVKAAKAKHQETCEAAERLPEEVADRAAFVAAVLANNRRNYDAWCK
jgi:FtsZ-interacting cell division protein ZipA